jgi:hypothetical protein
MLAVIVKFFEVVLTMASVALRNAGTFSSLLLKRRGRRRPTWLNAACNATVPPEPEKVSALRQGIQMSIFFQNWKWYQAKVKRLPERNLRKKSDGPARYGKEKCCTHLEVYFEASHSTQIPVKKNV